MAVAFSSVTYSTVTIFITCVTLSVVHNITLQVVVNRLFALFFLSLLLSRINHSDVRRRILTAPRAISMLAKLNLATGLVASPGCLPGFEPGMAEHGLSCYAHYQTPGAPTLIGDPATYRPTSYPQAYRWLPEACRRLTGGLVVACWWLPCAEPLTVLFWDTLGVGCHP